MAVKKLKKDRKALISESLLAIKTPIPAQRTPYALN